MRNHAEDNYLASAVRDIERIDASVAIRSDDHILDIGCAAGRLALPLLEMLDRDKGGSYDGFDVKADNIAWAERTIGAPYAAFRFTCIDVGNGVANPGGKLDAVSVRFPYPDAGFDLIIANNVFPHMLGEAGWHYLSELRRTMAPSGSIYSTWFLWDDLTAEAVETQDSGFRFRTARDGYRLANPARPEATVAHHYERLLDELDKAGLKIASETRGNWRSHGNQGQDILLLVAKDK
jgi:SAM-dependent methyltransferase